MCQLDLYLRKEGLARSRFPVATIGDWSGRQQLYLINRSMIELKAVTKAAPNKGGR